MTNDEGTPPDTERDYELSARFTASEPVANGLVERLAGMFDDVHGSVMLQPVEDDTSLPDMTTLLVETHKLESLRAHLTSVPIGDLTPVEVEFTRLLGIHE